jgi:hypothetical protein
MDEAGITAFLLSPESSFITGARVAVYGGYMAKTDALESDIPQPRTNTGWPWKRPLER